MPIENLPKGPLNKTKLDRLLRTNTSGGISKQTIVAHREGLSVRVYPTSTKYPEGLITFQGRYRFNGTQQRIDYGHYPTMTLREAEEAHRNIRRKVEQGIDPKIPETEGTLAELLTEFTTDKLLVDRKDPHQAIRALERDIPPRMLRAKVETITRRHISDLLRGVVRRGAPVGANRLLALLKQLFDFGVERGYIDDNPAAAITRRSVGGTEQARDRNLSFSEIKALLLAFPLRELGASTATHAVDVHEITKLTLLFLLVTGQRSGEAQSLEWAEVDEKLGIWTIPAEKSKNGRSHNVPLTPLALNILRLARDWGGSDKYCFPSPRDPNKQMDSKSIARAVKRHLPNIGVASFTPHDLRRTFVTRLSDLGVAPHVIEKCVNHSLGGVMAVYNRGEYWPERQQAFEVWDEKLSALVVAGGNENVVEFPAPKQAV